MTGDQLLQMDVNLTLSIVNMRLRDFYQHLDVLCDDMDVSKDALIAKLLEGQYVYSEASNQFIYEDV